MRKKISSIIICILIGCSSSQAQVVISGLQSNAVLEQLQRANGIKSFKIQEYKPIQLPFVDDFSTSTILPDTSKWVTNHTFINNDYVFNPLTVGVATFDALDAFGKIHGAAQSTSFSSDTLTSRPIRLDSLFSPIKRAITIADSIYFSFFVQPGGGMGQPWELKGDKPESGDSLILEFGYFTGNYILSYSEYQPQIMTNYLNIGDSVQSQCYSDIWLKASKIYEVNDTMMVACDSVLTREMVWDRAWSMAGQSLQQLYDSTGKFFKQIMIPITNPSYLDSSFQFRFRNIASLGNNTLPGWIGNVDQWNVDYVKLNINRTLSDTLNKDVAFANSAPSTLKRYQSMPWRQFVGFQSAELTDSMTMLLTNLDNITKNTSYVYEVKSATSGSIYNYNGGSFNIDSYESTGYQTYQPHARPPIKYTYPEDTQDSATFNITHIFKEAGGADQNNNNDTIRYAQNFHNYYAYDDGTAENGFGLSPAGSKLAYKFVLNTADTLRGVNMFFNRTSDNSNIQPFWLTVWNDVAGKPGSVIYEQSCLGPVLSDSLNQYLTYMLNTPIAISGTFYIGWRQTTSNNLNIGFDRNNDVSSKIFYNSNGVWENTFYTGALMIRPMVGKTFSGVGVDEISPLTFKIFPNPITGNNFTVELSEDYSNFTYKIFDLSGRAISESKLSNQNQINVQAGLYFITIYKNSQPVHSQKIIIY